MRICIENLLTKSTGLIEVCLDNNGNNMNSMIIRADRQKMDSMIDPLNLQGNSGWISACVCFLLVLIIVPGDLSAQRLSSVEALRDTSAQEAAPVYRRNDQGVEFIYIITAEQLLLNSDRTVEEALARIPGVQRGRFGQFNIRGTSGAGQGLYNVTINGQRISTTGKGHRSIDLGSISTYNVSELEVVKVLTPDMDADALGGLINIRMQQPVIRDRKISVNYGSGFDSRYGDYIRPESSSSIQYSEALSENFSVSAGVSHQRNNMTWERLGVGYEVADFGNGNVDVIGMVSPSLNINSRNNWGSHVGLNYQASPSTTLFVNSYLNNSSQTFTQHQVSMNANGDWINKNETGEIGRRGSIGYDLFFQEQQVNQVMANTGATHLFSNLELGYRFGWSNSNLQEDQISLPFLMSGLDYVINMDNITRPSMHPVGAPIRRQNLRIQPMNVVAQEHIDNTFTGNIDVTIPFGSGIIRWGAGTVIGKKIGNFRDSNLRVAGLMDLSRFQIIEDKTFSVLGKSYYQIPWLIKPNNAKQFTERNYTTFFRNPRLQRETSDIWNYESSEGIYSAYGMATWNIGIMDAIGGLRVEYSDASYTGKNVIFNEIGFYVSTNDTTAGNSYVMLFPNLQLKIQPTELHQINVAYSRTIARPDFYDLTPFRLLHVLNGTIFQGNPRLKPMVSDNLDLLLGYNFGSMSHVSLGIFYKNVSNFVIERIRILEGGDFDGYVERTFETGNETADIYGVEISWTQRFGFLPGVLANMGTVINYTWSESNFNVEFRDDQVRLPGQSPHVINAAINYTQGRFTGQLAYHFTAESVVHLAGEPAGELSTNAQSSRDRYEDGASDLSATVRFRISSNFRLWVDASNLLGDERVQYTQSRSMYPVETDFRRSNVVRLGLRFDL